MKNVFITIILLFCYTTGFSQIIDAEKIFKTRSTDISDGWQKGGTIILNMSQVSLTNWAAGGQNSISGNGLLSLFAHKKNGASSWQNYLDIGYGTIKQGKKAIWWKTDDKIDFTSKYGKKAFSGWYYAGLLNFKTQMTPGYNYPDESTKISDLLAPGYLIGAIGLDYKKNDNFTAFFAPLTAKTTFVKNQTLADAGAFGVEPANYSPDGEMLSKGENIRTEFGSYIRLFYMKNLMENISMQTKLDLFSNYLNNPQNIDISWEVLLSMKVNKYISATLSTHLLYDDDVNIATDTDNDGITDSNGPKTQFKEVLGVGFSYKF
ncbi:DUF3078 domain-containing protein [Bacteroidota bacterium]